MQSTTLVLSQLLLESHELRRGINRIGLNLSDLELQALEQGNSVSLEGRGLSEIGSMFIMAAAVAAINLGKPRTLLKFSDLPTLVEPDIPPENASCPGIPIYCWLSNLDKKCCVYLTLTDSKPVLKIGA
ncbi:hypothetical protein [Microcystis aeruginosa]|jgi:hypothetical protein|uniref:Uncharacterized protein n=2 Tax=Microcystis TaxID=1125 RepID=A0A552QBE0_9CHRO|nr:hypothetical protein [Microcystis aeruginosa]TRV42316.1 MAG: hypothetical protein EWV43_23195 [Microcystis panniformis Mp_MB_F_20080800_S26D]TRV47813.1 MAG: hypothetical protein EWV87_13565 [Microcystis panniformis Mp_GB_SS_20050300_S99]TRV53196.1 MAG: hypothetical protein EWV42_06730 [Microcystis panniformis Mp_GB_SS_20050300_S99D]TRV59771.1 MAG: hypothetical protein EWV86_17505 [Microcystis panniformis Mp_MB_F_20051200_S9D]TRV64273.1 MAG: hypothetical protein EWV69_02020 [Microcystis pann